MNLICYLSNGYPTIEQSFEMAKTYAEAGCDIIEMDLPSENPYLESQLIAGRMQAALANCHDYDRYLDAIVKVKLDNPRVKILLLAYEKTLIQIGVSKFIDYCLKHGILDLIIVGHEQESIRPQLIENGLRVSCYVQFHMPQDEIDAALNSNGFVYMQAKPTNGHVNPDYPNLLTCIAHLRSLGITRPINCGVGVSTVEDIAMVRDAGGDGVFVGGAILRHEHNFELVRQTIKDLKAATV